MKLPAEPTARKILGFFGYCVVMNAIVWLVTPDLETLSTLRSAGWYFVRGMVPVLVGAISSEVPMFFWIAVTSILTFTLAVTTESCRSAMLAGTAFSAYGLATILVFWVEPFLVSTSSAALQSVSVALMIKFGVGFFELLFTGFWFYYPIFAGWKMRREFAAA